jgi:hypothetical protein
LLAVKNLNNGKAPGKDDIINKYIKSTVNQFLPIHVNLFNLIFSCGIIPDSWLVRIIKPIYKYKGDLSCNLSNFYHGEIIHFDSELEIKQVIR